MQYSICAWLNITALLMVDNNNTSVVYFVMLSTDNDNYYSTKGILESNNLINVAILYSIRNTSELPDFQRGALKRIHYTSKIDHYRFSFYYTKRHINYTLYDTLVTHQFIGKWPINAFNRL